jgi:hypothetical protein
MTVTKTLAYYALVTIITVKSIIAQPRSPSPSPPPNTADPSYKKMVKNFFLKKVTKSF